jgi:hypothetical protein
MNLEDISTQLLFTTVPVWTLRGDGTQSSGTGFILSLPVIGVTNQQVPLLVTNAHVVRGAQKGLLDFVERDGSGPKRGARLRIEVDSVTLTSFVDESIDLAIVPIGGLLNLLEQGGRPAYFRSVSLDVIPTDEVISNLGALEEITFIGYPSGLYDEHNVSPIIRRGITATPPWNDFQGLPAFLIDAGVFPGSCGSPVFILNQGAYATPGGLNVGSRLLFMGVLSEAILRTEANLPPVFLGIGRVIKAARVRQFAEQIRDRIAPPRGPQS